MLVSGRVIFLLKGLPRFVPKLDPSKHMMIERGKTTICGREHQGVETYRNVKGLTLSCRNTVGKWHEIAAFRIPNASGMSFKIPIQVIKNNKTARLAPWDTPPFRYCVKSHTCHSLTCHKKTIRFHWFHCANVCRKPSSSSPYLYWSHPSWLDLRSLPVLQSVQSGFCLLPQNDLRSALWGVFFIKTFSNFRNLRSNSRLSEVVSYNFLWQQQIRLQIIPRSVINSLSFLDSVELYIDRPQGLQVTIHIVIVKSECAYILYIM